MQTKYIFIKMCGECIKRFTKGLKINLYREILIIYIISKVTKYYHEVPLLKVFIKYQVSL